MNLNQLIDYASEQAWSEMVPDLVEVCGHNLGQFKSMILGDNTSVHKTQLLYHILFQLIRSDDTKEQMGQFTLMMLQASRQNLLKVDIFPILQQLSLSPTYQHRLIFRLLHYWRLNLYRVYSLRIYSTILTNTQGKQSVFNIIFHSIVQVLPFGVDYQEERQKAVIMARQGYFDGLVEGVAEFMMVGYQCLPEMRGSVVEYCLGFVGLEALSDKIIGIMMEFVDTNQKLIHFLIHNTCHDPHTISPFIVRLILLDQKYFCSTVSEFILSLFHIDFSLNKLDHIVSYICYSSTLVSQHHKEYYIVEWLRLFQLYTSIKPVQQKAIILERFFRVVESYILVIDRNRPLTLSLSQALINNLPLSFDTLVLFSNLNILPTKSIKQLQKNMHKVTDPDQKNTLWTIIIETEQIYKYSKQKDYQLVNKIGLRIGRHWKIDEKRLIQFHLKAIFSNEEQETQKLENIMQQVVIRREQQMEQQ